MAHYIAVHVDRYLRRLFPNVSVTTADRPELWATQISIMIKTQSGTELFDKCHFLPKEAHKYPGDREDIAADIARGIALDVMFHKPVLKEATWRN